MGIVRNSDDQMGELMLLIRNFETAEACGSLTIHFDHGKMVKAVTSTVRKISKTALAQEAA